MVYPEMKRSLETWDWDKGVEAHFGEVALLAWSMEGQVW
jgi:hypothetical protein